MNAVRLSLTILPLALGAACACASAVFIQVTPDRVSELPVSVQVAGGDFGPRFTVFFRTNASTLDRFLHANLFVADEDHQLASCPLEKTWKANGVEFTFTLAPGCLAGSKFSLFEDAHDGRLQPMPGFTEYWFYLRDFATNAAAASRQSNSNTVAPEIMKELPARVARLKARTPLSQVWNDLGLSAYQNHLGSSPSTPPAFGVRYWLTWNYELELIYQERLAGQPAVEAGRLKLVRATLFKNGLKVAGSGAARATTTGP